MKLNSTVSYPQEFLKIYQIVIPFLILLVSQLNIFANNSFANSKPSVSITSPASGHAFFASDALELTVDANDVDGVVEKVEYYSGEKLIASVENAPFSYLWINPSIGLQEITAHAYDNSGEKTVSTKIIISIMLNVPPSVSIASPSESYNVIQEGESITIQATANDGDGEVAKVAFYAGDTYLGEDETSPFSYSWEEPAVGTYKIKSKAYDNKGGAAYSSEVEIKVNEKPKIIFEDLENGSVLYTNSIIDIPVIASDADGEVKKVEFLVNGDIISENKLAPFSLDWNGLQAGIYQISTRVSDNDGGITESEEIKVFVRDQDALPVNFVNITTDTTVNPYASIPFKVEPSAGFEVKKVAFYIDGELIGEDNTYPFEMKYEVGDDDQYEVYVEAYYESEEKFESKKITLSIYKPLSLNKGISEEIGMIVSPNPTTNESQLVFNLKSNQSISYSLTDISGNELLLKENIICHSGENNIDINFRNMPLGMYILNLKIDDKFYIKKILKQ